MSARGPPVWRRPAPSGPPLFLDPEHCVCVCLSHVESQKHDQVFCIESLEAKRGVEYFGHIERERRNPGSSRRFPASAFLVKPKMFGSLVPWFLITFSNRPRILPETRNQGTKKVGNPLLVTVKTLSPARESAEAWMKTFCCASENVYCASEFAIVDKRSKPLTCWKRTSNTEIRGVVIHIRVSCCERGFARARDREGP
eukprot:2900473-Prymnesium_polylepis.1